MLTELRRKIGEHNENINKELKNINMDQYKVKNKMRNTLEGKKSRLGDTEVHIMIWKTEGWKSHIIRTVKRKANLKMRTG